MAVTRALVVEDDRHMRMLLGVLLREQGVANTVVAASKEAKIELHRELFAIVLIDVNLANESGIELVKWLRAERYCMNWRAPVLMVSGRNQRSTIEGARDAGADGFLVKPITAQA